MKKIFITIIALFFVMACDNGTIPLIITTTPQDNAINISRDITSVEIVFSKEMAQYWSISWYNNLGLSIGNLSWSADMKTLTYPVTSQLDASTTYSFVLNPTGYEAMQTIEGEFVPTDTTITFTTGN